MPSRRNQHKSASRLAELTVDEFTSKISEGLLLVAKHTVALSNSVSVLNGSGATRGIEILRVLAEEEAAKYLILLDAARFRYETQDGRRKQLKRFSSHLPKGIYARAYDGSPEGYGEVVRYVDTFRNSHYLDGPNGADWIFTNQIVSERAEHFYVDYVENDDGGGSWWSPERYDDAPMRPLWGVRLPTVDLVAALRRFNAHLPQSIELLRDVWRDFESSKSVYWSEAERRNIEYLRRSVELDLPSEEATPEDVSLIREKLLFPLNDVDMTMRQVEADELRAEQQMIFDEMMGDLYGP
jgi:hypothetical protein